jgi:large repetitive protein
MKFKILIVSIYLCSLVNSVLAQIPASWTVNPSAYNYSMTVTSKANVACVELSNNSNAIAAFVGTQCRGVVTTNTTVGTAKLALLIVYSNVIAGEKVNYKIYNSTTNQVYNVLDSIVFANNTQVGGLTLPIVMYSNHAPTNIMLANKTINENKTIGSLVGLLTATDVDANTTFSYTLAPNVLDNNMYKIVGNQLQSNAVFNYENDSVNTIELVVNDGGGCSYTKQFVLSILNVNDTPTVLNAAIPRVSDGQQAGSVMGIFTTIDEDVNQAHSYTLVAGIGSVDNNKFYISNDTLFNKDSIYYPTQNSYYFRTRSTDAGGLWVEDTFSIHVINLNHAPKNVFLSKTIVTENMPVGTVIATLTTFDPDVLDGHTYAIVNGVGGTDNAKVKIVGNQLQTAIGYDFETQDTLYIRLQTIDDSAATFTKPFIITVKDTNDAPTNIILAKDSIQEGNVIGALIGTLATTDQDIADTHTYALVAGAGDADNGKFIIKHDSVIANISYYYLHQTYTTRISTTDNAGVVFEKIIKIKITDKDYAPIANKDMVSVLEDVPSELNVLTNDTDNDNNINPTAVTITQQPKHGTVTVDTLGVVTYTSALNYNGIDSLYYSVCDSTKIAPLCDTALVIITVINVADKPVANKDSSDVVESTPTVVFVLNNDTDADTNINIASIIITQQPKNGTVAVNLNGTITYTPTAYYNGKDTLSYSVCDKTLPNALCDTAMVILNVTPVFNTPYAISLDTLTFNEDNTFNTVVARAFTRDYDVTDTFTYTLVDGFGSDDNQEFKFVNNELVLLKKANYDVQSSYAIRLRSTDNTGLFYDTVFVLTVKDINPNTIALPSTNFISPNDDGKNDYWVVDDVHIYRTFELKIFDQYGQVIYSKDNNYNNEFNGKYNDVALPSGNYYYQFKKDTKTFKGNITIIN